PAHLSFPPFPTRRSSDLVDSFLHRLRRAIDQVLGFLEAEARELAHRLDDIHLVVADRGENDRELGLFLGNRCMSSRRCASSRASDRKSTRLNSSHQIIPY